MRGTLATSGVRIKVVARAWPTVDTQCQLLYHYDDDWLREGGRPMPRPYLNELPPPRPGHRGGGVKGRGPQAVWGLPGLRCLLADAAETRSPVRLLLLPRTSGVVGVRGILSQGRAWPLRDVGIWSCRRVRGAVWMGGPSGWEDSRRKAGARSQGPLRSL